MLVLAVAELESSLSAFDESEAVDAAVDLVALAVEVMWVAAR